MRSNVSIQPARSSDIRRVLEIQHACGLSVWSHKDYLDELARTDSVFLRAIDDGVECLGFLIGRKVPGDENTLDLEIYNIGVEPSLHRSGIGSKLMQELLKICQESGVRNIWLDVRASNLPAQAFYSQFGFVVFGSRPHFYSDPPDAALIMHAVITPIQ